MSWLSKTAKKLKKAAKKNTKKLQAGIQSAGPLAAVVAPLIPGGAIVAGNIKAVSDMVANPSNIVGHAGTLLGLPPEITNALQGFIPQKQPTAQQPHYEYIGIPGDTPVHATPVYDRQPAAVQAATVQPWMIAAGLGAVLLIVIAARN